MRVHLRVALAAISGIVLSTSLTHNNQYSSISAKAKERNESDCNHNHNHNHNIAPLASHTSGSHGHAGIWPFDENSLHPLSKKHSEYEDQRALDSNANNYVLLSGTNCQQLRHEISTILQTPLSPLKINHYADGEISVQIEETVRGRNVYILQSTCAPIHENLMQLLFTISAARRASAQKIIAVIPYFGYCRQDTMHGRRQSMAAADICSLLVTAGVDQIITIDIHRRQIEAYFDENVLMDNLESLRAVVPVLMEKELYNPVIVCTSDTGVFRARKLRRLLADEGILASISFVTTTSATTIEFAESDSHHRISGQKKSEIIGEINHCDCIIVSDIIDTGSRILNAAEKCHQNGAFRIFAFATHGLFSDNCVKKLEACAHLNEVFVCNTIYPPINQLLSEKISYVSIGPIIAESIRRIQIRNSLASMTHIKYK